ncbi:MAG: N-acetylmuramidase domain-containing protein [Caldilineales bacterium]|nr:N-acetylmuramidase domain-containing protein [Caldilineales bacterium]
MIGPHIPPPLPIPSPDTLRARERIGIDANNPLEGLGPSPRLANPALIADTGVGWVRLNFVLGDFASVEDAGWEQCFRQIIAGLKGRGLKIYGLINCEAVRPTDFGDALRQRPANSAFRQEWLDRYVETFASIVRRFQADVAVWESFNEPDDWHHGKSNWVHPGWFAILLERIYNKVKSEMGLSQVRLASGPVQGLGINRNAGAEYLRQTYREGKRRFGWGASGKAFPFDGVGYHLYVEEGPRPWEQQARQVPITYARYLKGVKDVIQAEEGGRRPIFVSEVGWHSNGGQDDFQSRNLPLGLELLLKDPWIELAVWFCTQDFGPLDGDKYYGVYRPGGLDIGHRKPVYATLQTFCAREWQGLPVAPVVAPVVEPIAPRPPSPAPLPQPDPLPDIDVPPVIEPRPVVPDIDVAPIPLGATNNQVINAFNRASIALGLGNWGLMGKAGLSLGALVKDRRSPYRGPALDAIASLSAEERQQIRAALPDDVDFGFPVHDAFLARWPELSQTGLDLPAALRIDPAPDAGPAERRLAAVWNRFGFLLVEVADILKLPISIATAVLALVADRRGMDEAGRLVIRFEIDAFWDRWGQGQAEVFARHFSFDPDRPWQQHRWRPSAQAGWREVHRAQNSEWAAFRRAVSLDQAAALDATALGFPRLMGLTHAAAGYDSAKAMLDAFASHERFQALAWFDFIAGPAADSRRLQALRQGDLDVFAALHYGPAGAPRPAALLRQMVAAFERVDPLA